MMRQRDDEAHMQACLARHVLRLPFRARRPWLLRWEKRHGRASANALRGEISRQHRSKQ